MGSGVVPPQRPIFGTGWIVKLLYTEEFVSNCEKLSRPPSQIRFRCWRSTITRATQLTLRAECVNFCIENLEISCLAFQSMAAVIPNGVGRSPRVVIGVVPTIRRWRAAGYHPSSGWFLVRCRIPRSQSPCRFCSDPRRLELDWRSECQVHS